MPSLRAVDKPGGLWLPNKGRVIYGQFRAMLLCLNEVWTCGASGRIGINSWALRATNFSEHKREIVEAELDMNFAEDGKLIGVMK